jgi:hypothetical protein
MTKERRSAMREFFRALILLRSDVLSDADCNTNFIIRHAPFP